MGLYDDQLSRLGDRDRLALRPARFKSILSWLGGALLVVVLALMLRYEFSGRFVSPLDLTSTHTLEADGYASTIKIVQHSTTPTDTTRHEFKNAKHGVVDVSVMSLIDTLMFASHGHFYSEFRKARFSSTSSTELLLVPNTEHGLGFGLGEVLYLKPDSTLGIIHLESSNVGDIDSDRVFEVFDPRQNTFTHLDRIRGVWAPYKK